MNKKNLLPLPCIFQSVIGEKDFNIVHMDQYVALYYLLFPFSPQPKEIKYFSSYFFPLPFLLFKIIPTKHTLNEQLLIQQMSNSLN